MGEPLKPDAAKKRIREILRNGEVIYSRPHALDRLRERNLTMVDCENVLRGGKVVATRKEKGNWRYKVSTANIEVIIVFLSENVLLIVTAIRTGKGKRK